MNELVAHVEQAVRAVFACPARKQRMRQELLAHLTELVAAEKAHGLDDQQAVAAALRRFGDPACLARDLQAAVPRWEAWECRTFFRTAGESEFRYGLRLSAIMAASGFVGVNLVPLVRVAAGEAWADVRVDPAAQIVATGYLFLSFLTCHGLFRALTDRLNAPALLRAAAYAAAAVLVGLALIGANFVAQPDNPLWGFILTSPADPLALSAGAGFAGVSVAVTLALALYVRAKRAWGRHPADWPGLEMGA